jgi:hypothetical protein
MRAETRGFELRLSGQVDAVRNPVQRGVGGAVDASASKNLDANVASERATLEARVFRLIADRRKVRIDLGRTLIKLKNTTKHGSWKPYFEEIFATSGMSLRSAERYMKMAAQEEEESKNDKLAIFKKADDPQAAAISSVTATAESEVAAAVKRIIPRRPNFYLPLFLSAEDQKSARRLLKSVNWPKTELEITRCLRRMLVKFNAGNGDSQ